MKWSRPGAVLRIDVDVQLHKEIQRSGLILFRGKMHHILADICSGVNIGSQLYQNLADFNFPRLGRKVQRCELHTWGLSVYPTFQQRFLLLDWVRVEKINQKSNFALTRVLILRYEMQEVVPLLVYY